MEEQAGKQEDSSQPAAEDDSPLAMRWAKLKKLPAVASLIFLATALAAGLEYGQKAWDFWKSLHPEFTINEVLKDLGSDAPEIRVGAIHKLARLDGSNADDIETAVRALEVMVNRRAPQLTSSSTPTDEVALAIKALGEVLKLADSKGLQFQAPAFANISLAKLDLSNAYLRGVNFIHVDLRGVDLSSTDLRKATFQDVRATQATAQNTNLAGAQFEGSCMQEVDLRKAILMRAIVARSDLNNTDLRNADLNGAVFTESRLQGADLKDADAAHADFTTATELTPQQLAMLKIHGDQYKPPTPVYQPSKLAICP